MKTEIKQSITVTTAEVIITIRDETGCIIMQKTIPLQIPEKVSDRMNEVLTEVVVMKHEYRMSSTTVRTAARDGTLILADYIDKAK